MGKFVPGSQEWLDQVAEEIVEPERRIIDAHHHLWRRPNANNYLLGEFWADTGTGHRIEKSVFIEVNAGYRNYGPRDLRCVGETEFVLPMAEESEKGGSARPVISAIVGHADLTLGDAVEEVLREHIDAAKGRFRGIRHIASHDPGLDASPRWARQDLYSDRSYREGSRTLGKLGLTQDCWHLHHQNHSFMELARAVPETAFILNHFGTPVGIGRYAGSREEIFEQWRKDIRDIAGCANTVAKLGGLAMPINGFGWSEAAKPATSAEIVDAQKRYYMHAIECFGPDRCMFESNFPVERASVSYAVLWNAFKRMVADFSDDDKDALFYRTAARVYRI